MPELTEVGVRLSVTGGPEAAGQFAKVKEEAASTATELRALSSSDVLAGFDSVLAKLDQVASNTERLGVASRGARAETDNLGSSMSALNGHLNTVSGTLSGALYTGLKYGGLGLAGLAASAEFFGLKAAASIQQTKIAFETLTGSAPAGDQLFASLQQFNLKSPFELPDLNKATQTLLQYGFTAQNVLPVVKTLANVASAGTDPTNDLLRSSLALGQISSAGVLRGQDINQLTQAGFPIIKLLQQVTGQDAKTLQHQLQSGGLTIPASDVVAAISAGNGPTLGRYATSAERANNTLSGQLSNVKDSLFIGLGTATQPAAEMIQKNIGPITDSIQQLIANVMPPLNQLVTTAVEKLPKALLSVEPALIGIENGVATYGPTVLKLFGDLTKLLPPLAEGAGILVVAVEPMVSALDDFLNLPFGIGTGLAAGLLGTLVAYKTVSSVAGIITEVGKAIKFLTAAEVENAAVSGVTGGAAAEGAAAARLGAGAEGAAAARAAGGAGAGGAALSLGAKAAKFGGAALGAGFGLFGLFDATKNAVEHGTTGAGILGGASSGALAGAAIGSVIPGLGTVAGAVAGGSIGIIAPIVGGTQHHYSTSVTIVNPQDSAQSQQAVKDAIDAHARENTRRR